MALLFIDLDRFKEINDPMGHHAGDTLLIEAASRISGCVRETDTVARLGGDEFTVILGELDDSTSVDRISQHILQNLGEPFKLGHDMAYVSASIGVTFYPGDAETMDELLKHADQAMYAAKNQGRNRYSYFTASMQEAAQARMRMANDLRHALANNEFLMYYQPIVDLASGAIQKAEALLRWKHPTRGLVGPAEFIPIAEETGLIVDIGNWVFREAATQAVRWRGYHDMMFQISINSSPIQFYSGAGSRGMWMDHLANLRMSGQGIAVEITEGILMEDSDDIRSKLIAFRDLGIQVSLDDFGTGYSSLSYLKKFDIDYLKIDQSFVRNLAPDSDDMALCEAIIVMAHKLGLKVVAEGIETLEQRDLLTSAGCDYGQGFYFSKPVPASKFDELLAVSAH
jgi:diguanylate cyclase (GGDEF)-like protein